MKIQHGTRAKVPTSWNKSQEYSRLLIIIDIYNNK